MKKVNLFILTLFAPALLIAGNVDFVSCCDTVCSSTSCTPTCTELDASKNVVSEYEKLYDSFNTKVEAKYALVQCTKNHGFINDFDRFLQNKIYSCGGNTDDAVKRDYCDWFTGQKTIAAILGKPNTAKTRLSDVVSRYGGVSSYYVTSILKYALENKNVWDGDLVYFFNRFSDYRFFFISDSNLFKWLADKMQNTSDIIIDSSPGKTGFLDTKRTMGYEVKHRCYDNKPNKDLYDRETLLMYASATPNIDHDSFCAIYRVLGLRFFGGGTAVYRDFGKPIDCYKKLNNKICS